MGDQKNKPYLGISEGLLMVAKKNMSSLLNHILTLDIYCQLSMSRHDRTLAECNTDFKNATRRKQFPTFLPTETAFMVPPFVGRQPLSKQGKGERGPIKRFKFTPPLSLTP